MTGKSSDYDAGDVDGLVDKIEAIFGIPGIDDGPPDVVTFGVHADIEWNQSRNPRPVRTTWIPSVDVAGIRAAHEQLHQVRAATGKARPMARSWGAQLRALQRTREGRELLAGTGFNPSAGTLRRWDRGTQTPGRANRDRIERAAREQYQRAADRREAKIADAKRAVADAVTAAIEAATGADVRFRDIEWLEFD